MSTSSRDEPAIVVGKTYDFVLWLLPKAEKFSRAYRFTVGERLVVSPLDPVRALQIRLIRDPPSGYVAQPARP